MNKYFAILITLFVASTANAFDFSDIINWTGSGSNESALEIDWEDGTTQHALVWGYRWNGSATGEQMVDAIAAANPNLTFTITNYGSYGDFVDEFAFNGSPYGYESHSQNSAGQNAYWEYFQGVGTSVPTYTSQDNGFTLTSLSNNSWDGWAWEPTYSSSNLPTANPSAAPVPEPLSLGLLALGALCLRKRR